MATALNEVSLRRTVKDPDRIEQDPWAVLRGIMRLALDPLTENAAVELTLWALENRQAFGPTQPVLNSLVHAVGLHPYADPQDLGVREQLLYEFNRPLDLPDKSTVFHRVQADVYRRLLAGESIVLSAPTSFGKSLIIDAMVATRRFDNIAIIVPTLALIDETRRRLSSFRSEYKIITHPQQGLAKRNLFILTAERAKAFPELPKVNFFVIDEFYKLSDSADQDRMVVLNAVFYRLFKTGAQFYLLGPSIKAIPADAEQTLKCTFIQTNFATVVSELIKVDPRDDELEQLVALCKKLTEPTLVFCRSPARVNEVARALMEQRVGISHPELAHAAQWIASKYHPDWVLGQGILHGIGIHHGKLPRSLGQYVVRAFNSGHLRFLICTSTLIEGVNTKAKNVVIFDNQIARQKIDFFTYNNIRGRSGRMFQHFVGRVYVFHSAPIEEFPFVDIPTVTQDDSTPTSLLVQLDAEDLRPGASTRVDPLFSDGALPPEMLRENAPIAPESLLSLAREIESSPSAMSARMNWKSLPTYQQLSFVCDLMWKHFPSAHNRAGVRSAAQLALRVFRLRMNPDVAERIQHELKPGKYQARSADEAVERVLDFDRTWAAFEFPKLLMAVSRVQQHVLARHSLPAGDFRYYASQVESLFRPPVVAALDEYGIPVQVGERIAGILGSTQDLDVALERLRGADLGRFVLSRFELELLEDARGYL